MKWVSMVQYDYLLSIKITDKDGNVIYEGQSPEKGYNHFGEDGAPEWPEAKNVAKALLKAGPLGSIKIVSKPRWRPEFSPFPESYSLYGFKELWEWGVLNAGMAKITDN